MRSIATAGRGRPSPTRDLRRESWSAQLQLRMAMRSIAEVASRTQPHGMREDRDARVIRPVGVEPGFHRLAEGSALYRAGGTVVLCTASIEAKVPEFMEGRGKGWITAEYQMHPRANPKKRENRDGRDRPLGGRAREIQRLIGRALRAAIFMSNAARALAT